MALQAEDMAGYGEVYPLSRHIQVPSKWLDTPSDEMLTIYPDVEFVNMLGQQRGGNNPRQHELEASIRVRGVLEPIITTVFDGDTLQEYLDFTNRVWSKTKTKDDLHAFAPDQYLVVVAGHSRVRAVQSIKESSPNATQPLLRAQLRKISSISEFMSIQVEENIHDSPPQDRAARAYAEAYLWELSQDESLTRSKFARQNNITLDQLTSALLYAELPKEIRELTDNGMLPFSVSVELAKVNPLLQLDRKIELESQPNSMSDEEKNHDIHEFAVAEMTRFIAQYNGRLNRHITNTKALIRHHAQALREKHSSESSPKFELHLFDTTTYDNPRARTIKELELLHNETAFARRRLHNRITALIEAEGLQIDDETLALLRQLGNKMLSQRPPEQTAVKEHQKSQLRIVT